jgi:glucose/arabinose dehydrogenase
MAQPAADQMPFPLKVPAGFRIGLVSSRIPGARFLAVAPNGDILVSLISRGEVVAVSPIGQPVDAQPRIVAKNLPRPNGLEFHGDDLYIATWTGAVVIRNYSSGNRTLVPLFSDLPRGPGHNARALAVQRDGTVFISSGSSCNICNETDPLRATILRYRPGGKGSIYASGLRNASGLAFDSSGRLWAVVNQRDNLYPDHTNLPPDELDLIVEGGSYGWPECYPIGNRRVPNPEYPQAVCSETIPTALNFQAHSAPLQIAFYHGSTEREVPGRSAAFPSRYSGSLFVAFHGSWNRQPPTGYKVVAVSFKDGKPQEAQDFITGWLTANNRVLGRPVGVAFAPDGTLFVSDDHGYLFHITYDQ